MNEAGYVEKQNLLIEYRWADFQYERLPALAAELVKRPVDAIFATGSVVSAIAAKSATANIPIVFANGSDPIQYGLVASLNRPGGNITGITFINSQLGPKRIQLLRLLNPKTAVIAVLVNPKNPNAADAGYTALHTAVLLGHSILRIACCNYGLADGRHLRWRNVAALIECLQEVQSAREHRHPVRRRVQLRRDSDPDHRTIRVHDQ